MGTCVGQSVGICGGSVELVKRKRKTLEGTCVGQCIGSGQFGSIELDGSIGLDGRGKLDGGRALDLVENSNEEVSFGEESWEVISKDTLGDAGEQQAKAELEGGDLAGLDVMVSRECFGLVVVATLGSWMAWRLLAWQSLAARQSLVARGAVFS